MSQKLRPDQRVRTAKDFQVIFKKGRQQRGARINLWVYETRKDSAGQQTAKARFGILVSKKVDTRSSRRNLWKRRIREAWRTNQARVRRGIMVVIQANALEPPPSYSAIKEELEKLLERTGVLNR